MRDTFSSTVTVRHLRMRERDGGKRSGVCLTMQLIQEIRFERQGCEECESESATAEKADDDDADGLIQKDAVRELQWHHSILQSLLHTERVHRSTLQTCSRLSPTRRHLHFPPCSTCSRSFCSPSAVFVLLMPALAKHTTIPTDERRPMHSLSHGHPHHQEEPVCRIDRIHNFYQLPNSLRNWIAKSLILLE